MSDELKQLLDDAKELLNSGKKDEYLEALKSIYENHKDGLVIYLLFVQYISRSDYETALHYLLLLRRTNAYMNDYYTYMLLISNFVNIPDDVREKFINLEDEEFLLSYKDTRFESIKYNNLARKAIANGDYVSAYNYMKTNQIINKIQSQEYVIYRLLNEKVNKQQKRLMKAFNEERYEDILDELNIIAFPSLEERTIIQLVYDICDITDGVVFNRRKGNSRDLFEAIYDHDYGKALTFVNNSDNELMSLLLKKIVELTKENIVEQYKGNLGNLFYEYCYRINEAIEQRDYVEIKDLAENYLSIIERRYEDFIVYLVDYFEAMGNGIENIFNILADLTYRKYLIDSSYLKKLFGDAIRAHNYEAAEFLIKAIESLRDDDKNNINVDYLRHVYKYQRYLSDNVAYEGLDEDLDIYNKIKAIHCRIMAERIPEKIIAKDEYEEKVIRNAINGYNNLAYMRTINDDGTITFYIKKQNIVTNFDRDSLLYHAKFLLRTNNYQCLKGLLLHGLTLINRFDYTILSLLAYTYEKLGEEENLKRISEVLNDICEIADYHEVVEDDELALMDVDSEYMYNIPNIELIVNEVINEGTSIDDVRVKYNINDEDISYVIALIARELYKAGNRELGDKYYIYAENVSDNTSEFDHLLKCIKANKSYYNSKYNVSFVDYVKKLISHPKTNE